MTPISDAKFITNPNQWPSWPFLPIKRHPAHTSIECGLLIDGQSLGTKLDPNHKSIRTIYMVNLFALAETDISKVEKKEYDSVEKMLADGWIVD